MRQSHTLHNSHFKRSHKCRPSDKHLHYHRREWFVYNLRFLLLIIEVNIIIEFRYAKLSGHDNILDYEKYFLSKTYTYKMSYVLNIFLFIYSVPIVQWTTQDLVLRSTNIFCKCITTSKSYLFLFKMFYTVKFSPPMYLPKSRTRFCSKRIGRRCRSRRTRVVPSADSSINCHITHSLDYLS